MLSSQRVSELMKELGFSTHTPRPTPKERLQPDFQPEIEEAITSMRERINERYSLHEVIAEDEIMIWNTGVPRTSYGLRGGYASSANYPTHPHYFGRLLPLAVR